MKSQSLTTKKKVRGNGLGHDMKSPIVGSGETLARSWGTSRGCGFSTVQAEPLSPIRTGPQASRGRALCFRGSRNLHFQSPPAQTLMLMAA